MNADNDPYSVREVLDQTTGVAHRFYSYKRRPCHRVLLTGRLAAQLSGYVLIEKDLRSAFSWLSELHELHTDGRVRDGESYSHSRDRKKYVLVKGLFVAAITFYGKCFSKCEGRPVKLERSQLDPQFLDLHDTCMRFRHNFAAHSGAERLEYVDIALVIPTKRKSAVLPRIYKELSQPDVLSTRQGELSMQQLFEHVRGIALGKMQRLTDKILNEEVLPRGMEYWLKR